MTDAPVSVVGHTPAMKLGRVVLFLIDVRNRLTPVVARRRHTRAVRIIGLCAGQLLDMVANVSFELERNGELRILEQLSLSSPEIVLDVGANVGDWSAAATRVLATAQIHAFEIVPDTARTLRDRVEREGLRSVSVNAVGLSDSDGVVPVAYLPNFSEGSSAAIVQPSDEVRWIDCPVRTGDAYCAEHGIDHIDLLKIDVEGLEDRVLKGFDGMLSRGVIDVIQFEYGHINASVRVLLGEFYELFERYGYAVGKIYPDGVEFRAFDPWRDENFKGPNYLAVHRSQTALLERLRAPSAV
jgi:FkbM family methyltransferase